MNDNKGLINISKRSFFSVLIILVLLMIGAYLLTFLIPQGMYPRNADGIITGEFTLIYTDNLSITKLLLAPINIFGTSDGLTVVMICIFLFVLGGFFNVMDKTSGIKAIIKKLIIRFKDRKYTLIRLIVLVFMIFGAFFGVFEESVALLPVMILLSLSLGYDTLLALGMTLLAAGFGFASAITNPFSIGVATELAGINILSGVWLRVLVFIIMYFIVSTFLVMYAKRIEKNPKKSLTYEQDVERVKGFEIDNDLEISNESKIVKVYVIVFTILLFFIVAASVLQLLDIVEIPTIVLMALTFLIGGFVSGYIITKDMNFTFKAFMKGVLDVLPAALLIILASSVKYIIQEGNIMDSMLYYVSEFFTGRSPVIAVIGIYLMILFIQFFIGSASAKAFLIMPILVPLVSILGISSNLAILAFVFGDGYTNVIFPTNGVLLIGLSIANVSYGKWFKWTYKLQLVTLLFTILVLILAVFIGY